MRNRKALWLLLAILLLLNSQYGLHGDEGDNYLGGYRIAHGDRLYADYWSHHMPLPYYLAASIAFIASNTLWALRFGWALLIFGYWQLLAKILPRCQTRVLAVGLFVALLSPCIHAQMLLAESIAGYAAIGIWLILQYGDQRNTRQMVCVWSLVLALAFSALVYAYLAVALVLLVTWHYRERWLVCMGVGTLALFVALLAVAALDPGLLVDRAYRYNAEVYAPYLGDPQTPIGVALGFLNIVPALLFLRFDSLIPLALLVGVVVRLHYEWRWRNTWMITLILLMVVLTFYPMYGSFRLRTHMTAHYLVTGAIFASCLGLPYRWPQRVWRAAFAGIAVLITPIACVIYLGVLVSLGRGHSLLQPAIVPLDLRPGETVWFAPQDTYSQLAFADHLGSRHAFLLPWIAADPASVRRVMEDFGERPPDVLVIDRQWRGYDFAEYAPEIWAWAIRWYDNENGVLRRREATALKPRGKGQRPVGRGKPLSAGKPLWGAF